MKQRPYEVIRASAVAENSLLLPEDLGSIYAGEGVATEYLLAVKRSLHGRAEDDVLYASCRAGLIEVHCRQLARCNVKVRRVCRLARSKRYKRLGVRDLYLTQSDEPVMFCFGNGEASTAYRKAYAQTLMLVTGARHCIESTFIGGGAGSVGHSGAVRMADKEAQRTILETVRSFWRRGAVSLAMCSRDTLLAASAQSQKTRKLDPKALDVVESLENAKQGRKDLESQISSLETNLLRRMRGAHRGLLGDGTEIVVTAVHRDAHYVGPADYEQIRRVTTGDADDD
jgi:hypothetical protein